VFVPGKSELRLSLIYVNDLVRSLRQAAVGGQRLSASAAAPEQSSGIYFVAMDESCTLAEFGRLAGEVFGREGVRTVPIPRMLCRAMGSMNDFWALISSRPQLLSSDKMCEALAGSWLCKSDKAKREWGFHCEISLREGIKRAADWYIAQGWL
jgi:nucleoside-diphosphate-sugar epimerase